MTNDLNPFEPQPRHSARQTCVSANSNAASAPWRHRVRTNIDTQLHPNKLKKGVQSCVAISRVLITAIACLAIVAPCQRSVACDYVASTIRLATLERRIADEGPPRAAVRRVQEALEPSILAWKTLIASAREPDFADSNETLWYRPRLSSSLESITVKDLLDQILSGRIKGVFFADTGDQGTFDPSLFEAEILGMAWPERQAPILLRFRLSRSRESQTPTFKVVRAAATDRFFLPRNRRAWGIGAWLGSLVYPDPLITFWSPSSQDRSDPSPQGGFESDPLLRAIAASRFVAITTDAAIDLPSNYRTQIRALGANGYDRGTHLGYIPGLHDTFFLMIERRGHPESEVVRLRIRAHAIEAESTGPAETVENFDQIIPLTRRDFRWPGPKVNENGRPGTPQVFAERLRGAIHAIVGYRDRAPTDIRESAARLQNITQALRDLLGSMPTGVRNIFENRLEQLIPPRALLQALTDFAQGQLQRDHVFTASSNWTELARLERRSTSLTPGSYSRFSLLILNLVDSQNQSIETTHSGYRVAQDYFEVVVGHLYEILVSATSQDRYRTGGFLSTLASQRLITDPQRLAINAIVRTEPDLDREIDFLSGEFRDQVWRWSGIAEAKLSVSRASLDQAANQLRHLARIVRAAVQAEAMSGSGKLELITYFPIQEPIAAEIRRRLTQEFPEITFHIRQQR